jgi:hypothetical protein
MAKVMLRILVSLIIAKVGFAGPASTTPALKARQNVQSFIGWTSASVYGSSTSCPLNSV